MAKLQESHDDLQRLGKLLVGCQIEPLLDDVLGGEREEGDVHTGCERKGDVGSPCVMA